MIGKPCIEKDMLDQMVNELAESFGRLVGITLLIVFLLIAWYIVDYIFRSLSLYKLGKAMNVSAYGLAWVPAARYWVVGGIVDKHDYENGKDHKFRLVLICLLAAVAVLFSVLIISSVVFTVLSLLPTGDTLDAAPMFYIEFVIYVILIMAIIAFSAFWIICFYKIFELCKPQSTVLNFMLGMLVPFAFPFVLFSCANAYIRRAEDTQTIETPGVPEEAAAGHDPD